MQLQKNLFDQAIGGSVIFCCLRKCGQIGKYYIFKVQYYMCILYKELLVCYIIRLTNCHYNCSR